MWLLQAWPCQGWKHCIFQGYLHLQYLLQLIWVRLAAKGRDNTPNRVLISGKWFVQWASWVVVWRFRYRRRCFRVRYPCMGCFFIEGGLGWRWGTRWVFRYLPAWRAYWCWDGSPEASSEWFLRSTGRADRFSSIFILNFWKELCVIWAGPSTILVFLVWDRSDRFFWSWQGWGYGCFCYIYGGFRGGFVIVPFNEYYISHLVLLLLRYIWVSLTWNICMRSLFRCFLFLFGTLMYLGVLEFFGFENYLGNRGERSCLFWWGDCLVQEILGSLKCSEWWECEEEKEWFFNILKHEDLEKSQNLLCQKYRFLT